MQKANNSQGNFSKRMKVEKFFYSAKYLVLQSFSN